jgi:hypothetical protein
MDSELIHQFVPIVAIIMTFGLPVGIVFVTKYFAFKHRELEAELEARKMLSERDRVELEKRIERLESVVMGVRVQQQGIPSLLPPHSTSALHEPPPSLPSEPVAGAVTPRERL